MSAPVRRRLLFALLVCLCVALVVCGILWLWPEKPAPWPFPPLATAAAQAPGQLAAAPGACPVTCSRQLEGMCLFLLWAGTCDPPATPLGKAAWTFVCALDAAPRGIALRRDCQQMLSEFRDSLRLKILPPSMIILAMQLDEPPGLQLANPLPDLGDEGALAQWRHCAGFLPLFRRFYREARVDAFLGAHAEEYAALAEHVAAALGGIDPAAEAQSYLGLPRPIPCVPVPSGLLPTGSGYGCSRSSGGKVAVVLPCFGLPGAGEWWQPESSSRGGLLNLIAHEAVHPCLNTLKAGETYGPAIAALEPAWPVVIEHLGEKERAAYGRWDNYWNETVVRAAGLRIVARIRAAQGLPGSDDAWVQKLAGEGWPFLPALLARLQEYEASRDQYPDLASFYPELLRVVEDELGAAPQ